MKKIIRALLLLLGLPILALLFFVAYAAQLGISETAFPHSGVVEFEQFQSRVLHELPKTLNIVTYNIGYASGDKNNLGNILSREEVEKNLSEMAEALKKLNPDIICMQEVDFHSHRTFDIDQFRNLALALQMPYGAYTMTWNKKYVAWPYWPLSRHFGRLVSGQAVLSRYPIVGQDLTVLPKPSSNPFWYNWFYLDRVIQRLRLKVGNENWALFHVHLEAFDPERRLDQLQILTRLVQHSSAPVKLAIGDFNQASVVTEGATVEEQDKTGSLQKFATLTGLRLAESGAPFFTMPSWKPVKNIDHIFYSSPLELQKAGNVAGLTASDHLPVWAFFTLEPTK